MIKTALFNLLDTEGAVRKGITRNVKTQCVQRPGIVLTNSPDVGSLC